jgi:ferritin
MNEQINKELFSSYLYLSMAAYFGDKNLPGFANWMRVQAEEEREHGMKFFDFRSAGGASVSRVSTPRRPSGPPPWKWRRKWLLTRPR